MLRNLILAPVAVLGVMSLTSGGRVIAQQSAAEPQQVLIERAPITLRSAESLDIPLKLKPARQTTLVAHVDGVIQLLRARPGEQIPAQTEVARLDSRMQQLELERSQAAYKAAQEEQGRGGSAARVQVAEKDMQLAELRLDRTICRVPFDAFILDVKVVEGAFVRAGDPLMTVADQSRLLVEVPVDRRAVRAGDNLEIKVEETTVSGKVNAIVPLNERFDPLRPLFQSIASGIVELDNSSGRFFAGQTAYSAMIPRLPVTEVPVDAVGNADTGGRKVQVIRDGVVRDVPVELLGAVGEQHVWVSGRFGPEDQLILRTSEPLLDGSLVALQNQPTPTGGAAGGTGPRGQAVPTTPQPGTPVAPRSSGF